MAQGKRGDVDERPSALSARRSTITPEAIELLIEAAREGNHLEACAGHARVPVRTLFAWLERGRAVLDETPPDLIHMDDLPFEAVLALEIEHALGAFQVEARRQIMNLRRPTFDPYTGEPIAGTAEHRDPLPSWHRWAWLLERRWPHLYAKRTGDEESGSGDDNQPPTELVVEVIQGVELRDPETSDA